MLLGWVPLICHTGRSEFGSTNKLCFPLHEKYVTAVRGEPNAPEFFLRDVTGKMRSPWTLHVVVVSGSSEEI